jgi:hypothetical protein
MRMLLRVTIPVEAGNIAIKAGTLGTTVGAMLEKLKPEAAYFFAENGKRNAYIFFDMKNTSDIPSIAEPFFLAFNAEVELTPVMNTADMQAGVERAIAASKG